MQDNAACMPAYSAHTAAAQGPKPPSRPGLGLWWLARWLLVLLLVWDQVGSPLHPHHHDSGVDGDWSLVLQADDAADDGPYLDSRDDRRHLTHPTLALRPRADTAAQPAQGPATVLLAPGLPGLRLPALHRPGAAAAWQPDARPPPFTSPLCLPPAGRAPPLHA